MSLYIKEIRGVVNSEITNEFASNLGTIVGNFVGSGNSVVIGRDTRITSQMIKRSITAGIMASGIDVIDFGIAPIPTIHYGMDSYKTNVMISITGSHLHPEEIDIKIFSDHEIPLEQIHAERAPWDDVGNLLYVYGYSDDYINAVLKNVKREIIVNMAPKVVISCANGSTVPIAPKILSRLECDTILFGCQPETISSSRFTEPTPETLSLVSNLVRSVGADMGIALDNDGDRVVFSDEKGNIIRDQTILGLFAREALVENPKGTIVSSVVASRSLDDIVSQHGGKLIKKPVDLVLSGITEKKAIFGGDEPGLYVFPEFQKCFDAIFAAVKMLEIICKHNKPLSKLVEEIPEYHRTGFSMECEHDKKADVIENLKETLNKSGDLDLTDGIRADWEDSYVLVRPSRFEPLVRVYIEAKSSKKLQKLSHKIKKMIEEID